jgi:PAS domain S-box-containing protein
MLQKHFYDLLYPDDHKEKLKRIAFKMFAGKEPFRDFINRNAHKNGKEVWLSTSGVPLLDETGELVGYRGTDRDITERKEGENKIKKSEEKYRTVLENIPDAIWTSDNKGKTVFISPKIKEIYGYSPEEIYEQGEKLWFGRVHPDDVENVKHAFGSLFDTPDFRYDIEYRIRNKDGEWIWLNDRSIATYKKGGVSYADGVLSDITDRKQAEASLIKSETRYRDLVNNSLVGIFETTIKGELKFANDALARMYDFDSPEQMIAKGTLPRWVDLRQREQLLAELQEYGSVTNFELKTVTHTGRFIYVLMSAKLNAGIISGKVMDITDRVQIESALQNSELNLKKAQEVAHVGSWYLDLLENKLVWTVENYRIFGVPEKTKMTYEKFLEIVHPEDRNYVDKKWHAALEGEPYDIEHRLLIGNEVKWVREKAELDYDHNGIPIKGIGVTQDITKRKQAEMEIKNTREKLIDAEKIAQMGSMDWNLKTNKIKWSSEMYNILGVDPGMPVNIEQTAALIYPDDSENIINNLDMAFQRICDYNIDHRMVRSDGNVIWVHARADFKLDKDGRPVSLLCTVLDISERMQAQEELERSRESLAKAQEITHTGSWQLDVFKGELLWSDEIYRIFNEARGIPMTYTTFIKSIHPEEKTFVEESWMKAFKNVPQVIEYRIIAADRVKWVREQIEVKFKKEGELLFAVGIIQDITERKEAEKELRELKSELLQSTRNRTVVELTAALAHELNHPLGSILNNANAARRYLSKKKPDFDEIRDIIDDIISEDRRATDVMQKVRALMKHSQIELFPIKINIIIEDVLKLTHSDLIIKNVLVSKQFEKNPPIFKGDRVQLQQVFLNLIINATDAMNESKVKKIHISTAKQDSRGIIVCVRDSGTGFDEKEKEKLFEPFFTTKKEGLGMGLSVVKTIVKSHGGDIWVENNKKRGASFFVKFNI